MQPKLQQRIQRYGWDKAVDEYEPSWKQQLQPAHRRLLQMTALRPGERVLDVACGTGLVTLQAAAQVGTTGSVVGTDIADKMLTCARAMARQQGLPQLTFEHMDAEHVGFPDATFDAALCALGLMYVPTPMRALQEMYRVLKPGGRAVAAVWGERQRCGWAAIFPIVDARVYTDVCPLFFQLGAQDMLAQTFQAAGFTHITSARLSTTLYYDSSADACCAAFAGGPVALAYARFDAHTRQEVHAEYLAAIEPYRRGTSYALPGEFVVVNGRKI